MDKKQKLIISGLTVASLLAGSGSALATSFTMDSLDSVVHEEEKKEEEAKCSAEKKKEDEAKKKKKDGEMSCGEGSCGSNLQ